jgi:uncharacterized membrane protein
MDNEETIEDLRKRINELATELNDYRQKLLALQQEMERLQNKKPGTIPPAKPSQDFRFENFIGLRIIHFVGIVLLVIGLSIGVKYAIDRQLISEAMRIILAYSVGITLYLLSWKLKKKYQLFSAILFSGAMASLYFTTYAAFVYYGFFPFSLAFLLMVAFTIYTAFESIRYNQQEIAILGMVGAYGIPFLISANAGRADLFFSYIIFINAGIVFLSFKKRWNVMALLALFITWLLFILWGFFRYEVKDFSVGLIMTIVFYVLFIINAFADRLIRSESLSLLNIQQIIVNNIAFYLSALIVFGYGNFGMHLASTTGYMTVCMALFAYLSYLSFPSENILHQSLAVQAVVLVVMYIGFYWTGFLVTILWVAFSVILFSWGILSRRSWPRLSAILLMGVILVKLVIFDSSKFTAIQKVIAYLVIGVLLLILSFFYQRGKNKTTI